MKGHGLVKTGCYMSLQMIRDDMARLVFDF
jgi:hypothetical protein